MNKFYELEDRTKVPIYTKLKANSEASFVVKNKKEKDYDYYLCDNCKSEIKILSKKQEMSGGIVILPFSITKRCELKLVLCNKCLKEVIKSFETEE